MLPETLLICGIGLILAGIFITRISWQQLTFQKNKENCYELKELALYGGKCGTLKNLLRGLASIFTKKHRALLPASVSLLAGLCLISAGIVVVRL